MKPLRFIASLVAGSSLALAIAVAAHLLAQAFWPQYLAAEPHKHYTLTMLFARLAVGALSTAGGALATTALAQDKGQAGWYLGGLFLILSVPDHVYPGYAWPDYPVWYHLLYLSYLIPVAGLTARAFSRKRRR